MAREFSVIIEQDAEGYYLRGFRSRPARLPHAGNVS
jgi:hypothetical protein